MVNGLGSMVDGLSGRLSLVSGALVAVGRCVPTMAIDLTDGPATKPAPIAETDHAPSDP